jgi:hypothetical protein
VPAEEAAADAESPRIVFAAIGKHEHAVLADGVTARQAVLRSPAQTAQTRTAAVDAGPPTLEAGEVVGVDAGCCSACDELLEVAGKVRLDHADEAAPQNDVVCLVERDDAFLTYLKQRRPVERVEEVLAVKRCLSLAGEWL